MLYTDDTDAPAAESAPLPSEAPTDATETPAPSSEPAAGGPPDETTAGPPRDERGRFAPKAQDAEQAAGDGSAPADADPDAPDANPDDPAAAPPATDTVPPEASAATAETPFTFLHRGQHHAVEGAVRKGDGSLVVPAAAVARVEQMLSRGREAEVVGPQREQAWRREVGELRQQLDTQHAGVSAFSALFAGLPADPREAEEMFLGRALEFYQQLPGLREEMTRQELERRDRRIAELEGRAPAGAVASGADAPDAQTLARSIDATIGGALGEVRQALPDFKDFTDAELGALAPKLRARAGLFLRVATPDDEARWGEERARAGTPVFDEDAFVEELRLLAGPVLQQRRAAAAKAKADADRAVAAKRNGQVLAKSRVPPAPAPGGEAVAVGAEADFEDMDGFKRWASR